MQATCASVSYKLRRNPLSHQISDLDALGWNKELEEHLNLDWPGLEPGRVTQQHRKSYTVQTRLGEETAEVSGRLRHRALDRADLPAVGDWVALARTDAGALGAIHGVLPRGSCFSRHAAGYTTEEQVIAANIDHLFIVSSLTSDLNVRRLERYLTIGWESGADPVIVLTKTDLCDDMPEALAQVMAVAGGVEVVALDALQDPVDELLTYLGPGRTAALVGSSGVGKSTLVNRLVGEEVMYTSHLRNDGKGRHTTTRRELIRVPQGGALIDTPGMREVGLWSSDGSVDATFEDIASLATGCRFSDCTHKHEPGCAVKDAIDDGRLAADRLASYEKQLRELASLERRKDTRLAREEARRWGKIGREAKAKARHKV